MLARKYEYGVSGKETKKFESQTVKECESKKAESERGGEKIQKELKKKAHSYGRTNEKWLGI